MLGAIDNLFGLLIFVLISIVASWLRRKQGGDDENPMPAPPHPRRRPTATPAPRSPTPAPAEATELSWEEELRRLLQSEKEEAKLPSSPPPIIVQVPHRTPPPMPAETAPPAHKHKSVFEVAEVRNPTDVEVTPNFHAFAGLHESDQAYAQASQLDHTVQAHLRQVTDHHVGSTHVQHRAPRVEATQALGLMRDRNSLRAAMLASVILGPPRALSDQ